jgi:glucose/arabinose dehydrogenase
MRAVWRLAKTAWCSPAAKRVMYALQDGDGDGKAEKRHIIASGLYMPNGVAYRGGALYVAEVNRIIRYDNICSTSLCRRNRL